MFIFILKVWVNLVIIVLLIYAVRHWTFTWRRLYHPQRQFYHDLVDSKCPGLTVCIPMHNEELVAADCLDALLRCTYPHDRLELIPIDDHSEDATPEILKRYAEKYPLITPLYRRSGQRTKPAGLNDALQIAKYDIILVFDADYLPPRDLLRELATAFLDPEVGAVMGRVIPINTTAALLPRLIDLERTGGYQVDQQARYDMDLVVQYGGTVGGFRRTPVMELGGFDPKVYAEDTDLTMQLYIRGWKVAYANRAECYEEAPQTWDVRFRQLRRWARGHTQVFRRHWVKVMKSPYLKFSQKLDAILLLCIYMVSPILLSGLIADIILFLHGSTALFSGVLICFFTVAYTAYGNFAPFYQISAAGLLDNMGQRLTLLPFLMFIYPFNTWAVSLGIMDAFLEPPAKRGQSWEKTQRFRGGAVA